MSCNFHRYDYLEFTDARGAKTRYDTKVGTEKWPKVSTFKILNQVVYPVLGNSYGKAIVWKRVCFHVCVCLFALKGEGQEVGKKVCSDANKRSEWVKNPSLLLLSKE